MILFFSSSCCLLCLLFYFSKNFFVEMLNVIREIHLNCQDLNLIYENKKMIFCVLDFSDVDCFCSSTSKTRFWPSTLRIHTTRSAPGLPLAPSSPCSALFLSSTRSSSPTTTQPAGRRYDLILFFIVINFCVFILFFHFILNYFKI